MKNFTKTITNKTLFKPTRWLIMALMMLVGTSSAWAATLYLRGSFNGWGTGNQFVNNSCSITLNAGTYEFKIGSDDWSVGYGNKGTMERNNCSGWEMNVGDNCHINADVTGTYTFEFNESTKILSVTYPPQCISCCGSDIFRVAGSENLCGSEWNGNDDNNIMECSDDIFSKSYNITGNTSYTFKIVKNSSDWINTIYSNASITNKIALTTTGDNSNVTLSENPSSDGKLTIYYDPNNGIYATFEKSCNTPTAGNFTYTAPADLVYDGSEKAATVIWSDTQGGDITIYYKNGDVYSEEAPSAVGEYKVYVTTTENNNFCALTTKTEVGSFTITCPTPADSPIYSVTQQTTSCDETDNELGIITLTNYDPAYTYQLNSKAVTVTNNQITGLATGSYTISAAKTCGSAQSDPKSGSSVEITSTDLTPTIAKAIEISGDNEICAGESTELTCNVEASEGTIDSYSWNPAGTIDDNTLTTAILNETTNYVATVTITNDGCSKEFASAPYEVTVNLIPSLTNVDDVTLCSSSTPISVEDLITKTGATADNDATIKLYDEDEVEIEITEHININTQTTTTYKLKASTQTCSSDFVSFTLTVNPLPAAPALTSPDPVCEDATVQLPTEGLKWYDAETGGTEVQNTAIKVTGTYWAAAVQNKCESATRTRYDVTVNPKPTISISGNPTAVLYEDVTLTAEATDGATVKWYEGVVEKGEGLTYVVTSETATPKTITAKAFLNGCESEVDSHLVTFGEEDCSNSDVTIESTKIEIWCRETGSSQAGSNLTCYAWYKDGSNHELNSDNTNKGTKTSVTKTSNIEGQEYTYRVWEFDMQDYGDYDVYVIFKKSTTAWDWQTSDLKAGKRNNRYFFTYDGSQSEQSNRGEKYSESQSLSVTTHSISAPAVKTVSVNSEQGSGVVNFVGRVIKTGCAADADIWVGYQYKKANEEWPTTDITTGSDEKQLVPLGNNKGKVDFSKNIEGLGDGDYHFRAYVINGYGRSDDANNYDQGVYYGIDIPVTVSTQKNPIRNLQVKYADGNGDVLQDQNVTYCVGDNAYIKLIYDGSKLKPEEDEINISSTLENTFTLVEGEADDLYTFVVKGNETITVIAKNEENTNQEIEPATNSIDISTYVQPQTPSITLPEEMAVVCSNGVGATITVNEPQEGITYSLYIDGVAEAAQTKTPTEGTLQFTEIKTAGTYYVTAVNPSCPKNIAKSLDSKSIEVIDASANTIAIEPDEDTTNPWVPVKLKVTKNSVYDYTLVCKQDVTDVTESVVINKKDDIYTIKFPKPEGADITDDGQVEFDDIEYTVIVSLDGNVECGTTSATSEITLTQLVEYCTNN